MKNFKLYVLLIATVSSTCFQACSDASASKEKPPSEVMVAEPYLQSLIDAGFTRVPSVGTMTNHLLREKYKKEYGANFIGYDEMVQVCEDNGIITGPSSNYIKPIPEDAIATFSGNYKRITALLSTPDREFTAPDGKKWTNKRMEGLSSKDVDYVKALVGKVFIAAPLSHFDTNGMDVVDYHLQPKSKDPIIIIGIEGGYLELARWK